MCESVLATLCLEAVDGTFWGVLLEVVVFCYAVAALAVVRDQHLAVAVETFCVHFNLREDIAGASFIALGSAAPEIAINAMAALQGADSRGAMATNLGVGAVIGSGMIAFSAIPAVCAAFANGRLQLRRRPLLRDIVAYLAALAALTFVLADGRVRGAESVALLLAYGVHMAVLTASPAVRAWWRQRRQQRDGAASREAFVSRAQQAQAGGDGYVAGPWGDEGIGAAAVPSTEFRLRGLADRAHAGLPPTMAAATRPLELPLASAEAELEVRAPRGQSAYAAHLLGGSQQPAEPPVGGSAGARAGVPPQQRRGVDQVLGRALALAMRPVGLLLRHTCPACHYDSPGARRYPVTLAASLLWVTLLSAVVLAVAGRWARLTGAPATALGMLLIAAALGAPAAAQSVTAARRGFGALAVGNAMSAQIASVLVGLGAPWLIAGLASGAPVRVAEDALLRVAALFQLGNVAISATLLLGYTLLKGHTKVWLDPGKAIVLGATFGLVSILFLTYAFVDGGAGGSA